MSSEDSEMWRGVKEASKAKRASNEESSIALLEQRGVAYTVLNEHTRHYRVGTFDFWPSTGKYYDQRTGKGGRGVFNLLKEITKIS